VAFLGSILTKEAFLILACMQVPCSASLNLSGIVTVNDVPISKSNHRQAYVQQEDVFYSQLTVAEVGGAHTNRSLPALAPLIRWWQVQKLLRDASSAMMCWWQPRISSVRCLSSCDTAGGCMALGQSAVTVGGEQQHFPALLTWATSAPY